MGSSEFWAVSTEQSVPTSPIHGEPEAYSSILRRAQALWVLNCFLCIGIILSSSAIYYALPPEPHARARVARRRKASCLERKRLGGKHLGIGAPEIPRVPGSISGLKTLVPRLCPAPKCLACLSFRRRKRLVSLSGAEKPIGIGTPEFPRALCAVARVCFVAKNTMCTVARVCFGAQS